MQLLHPFKAIISMPRVIQQITANNLLCVNQAIAISHSSQNKMSAEPLVDNSCNTYNKVIS